MCCGSWNFLKQCKNLFCIIVLQFVGCLLGSSMVELVKDLLQEGLCHRLCDLDLLHPETSLLGQATADPYSLQETPKHSKAGLALSLWSLCVLGAHKVLFEPFERLCGFGIWFLTQFCPPTILMWTSPALLKVGYIFLVGSQGLPLTFVRQRVVILVFSQEKRSACPYTLPSHFSKMVYFCYGQYTLNEGRYACGFQVLFSAWIFFFFFRIKWTFNIQNIYYNILKQMHDLGQILIWAEL